MTEMTACREQFEKWAKDEHWPIHRVGCVEYPNKSTQYLWEGWQACWNTRPDSGEAVAFRIKRQSNPDLFDYFDPVEGRSQQDRFNDYVSRGFRPEWVYTALPSPDLSPLTALVGEWREEVVRMSKSSPVRQTAEACALKLQAALTQVGGEAREAKDAARYRWLRDQNSIIDDEVEDTFAVIQDNQEGGTWVGSDLDQAIDAAMRGDGENKP